MNLIHGRDVLEYFPSLVKVRLILRCYAEPHVLVSTPPI